MHRFVSSPSRVLSFATLAALASFAALAQAQDPKAADPTAGPAPAVDAAAKVPVAPSSMDTPPAEGAAPAPERAARKLSPMMLEIQAVFAAEGEKIAELRQRAARAANHEDAIAVQREIERVKFDTEIALLRVQAKHARLAGREAVATRIESAIADLLNPPKPTAPAARPIPTRETTSH